MFWYIFFAIWTAAVVYCIYEYITAPLVEDEKETTDTSDDTSDIIE